MSDSGVSPSRLSVPTTMTSPSIATVCPKSVCCPTNAKSSNASVESLETYRHVDVKSFGTSRVNTCTAPLYFLRVAWSSPSAYVPGCDTTTVSPSTATA